MAGSNTFDDRSAGRIADTVRKSERAEDDLTGRQVPRTQRLQETVWAKITGYDGTAAAYTWDEVRRTQGATEDDDDTWTHPTGGRAGTLAAAPAVDVFGFTIGAYPTGTIVLLRRTAMQLRPAEDTEAPQPAEFDQQWGIVPTGVHLINDALDGDDDPVMGSPYLRMTLANGTNDLFKFKSSTVEGVAGGDFEAADGTEDAQSWYWLDSAGKWIRARLWFTPPPP